MIKYGMSIQIIVKIKKLVINGIILNQLYIVYLPLNSEKFLVF